LASPPKKDAVTRLCHERGWTITAKMTEVESGKKNDRSVLAEALHLAEGAGATLVFAKLDRLPRNVRLLAQLEDSGVRFICAEMPEENELTVHIMAAVAQAERKMIGQRTRDALAAAKRRGCKRDTTPFKAGRLSKPNGAEALRRPAKGSAADIEAVWAGAVTRADKLARTIADIQAAGFTSTPAIARELNARGILTPRGGSWHPASVGRLLVRLAL
jgi:DNA invertase Pin-like site-specific DNA recombinase